MEDSKSHHFCQWNLLREDSQSGYPRAPVKDQIWPIDSSAISQILTVGTDGATDGVTDGLTSGKEEDDGEQWIRRHFGG